MNEGRLPALPIEPRDLALGGFMDAWSQMEANVRQLLSVLSGAHPQTSFSIAAAIPDVGRMHDLLLALGELQLDGSDQEELKAICNYFLISSKYRNSIVHGQWVVTANRPDSAAPPGFRHPYMWVRAYVMIDKTKEFFAVLGDGSKEEKRHVFTIERLNERAEKARKLAQRISLFSHSIKDRVRLPYAGPKNVQGEP